jgi:gamma-glutamylaminecyclotransferase
MAKPVLRVGVYGTLRRGFGNHRLLEDSTLVATGWTERKHSMYVSGIPFVEENGGTSRIKIEVYDVHTQLDLDRLDSLEGNPDWYKRDPERVEVTEAHTDDVSVGDWVTAEIYFYPLLKEEDKSRLSLFETGDYAREEEKIG